MREKCGEALKIVTVVLASVAQAGGALERAAEEEKDLAYDKTLFQNLLQDLKTAKSTESVKVLGVTAGVVSETSISLLLSDVILSKVIEDGMPESNSNTASLPTNHTSLVLLTSHLSVRLLLLLSLTETILSWAGAVAACDHEANITGLSETGLGRWACSKARMIRGLRLLGADMPSFGLWDSEPIASVNPLF